MSRIIIIVQNSHLAAKNALQKQAIEAVAKYDRRVLPSEDEFRHMEALLKKEMQDLNAAYPRSSPLEITSWKVSDTYRRMKIERVADFLIYWENVETWN